MVVKFLEFQQTRTDIGVIVRNLTMVAGGGTQVVRDDAGNYRSRGRVEIIWIASTRTTSSPSSPTARCSMYHVK